MARQPRFTHARGRSLLVAACFALLAREASCVKFAMSHVVKDTLGLREDCVTQMVPDLQWERMLETVERNWRKNDPEAMNGLSDEEVVRRLTNFRTPLLFELGFLTMSGSKYDTKDKPISYVVTMMSNGNMVQIAAGADVTQKEIVLKGTQLIGGRGPFTVCFRAPMSSGPIDIDISYFDVNVPNAVGTKYASSKDLSEEDIRDLTPTPTEEEMEYYAKEEHIIELKKDMRSLGNAVYQSHNEQNHIKQIQIYQHRCLLFIAMKAKVLGYLETFMIVLCSGLQVYFVRRLFKKKKIQSLYGQL
mmetsp:Transcript_2745/g.6934  ORF Transcript_2745/g.6934 Transcript_2745/m.6934 type:complete len:303 (-) Transcript_2745:114-1022(-)